MTAIEGGVIVCRAFYRFQAQSQQLENRRCLKLSGSTKTRFSFRRLHDTVGHRQPLHSSFANTGISFSITEI